ncbi:guanylate kinase [Clostridium cylindrosporum]|uniref:Guanylate kinase n=1 Tax=Clostridium cylindrosporum DSM 605 TaxID=1121307 RepID=A0A0J8G0Z4_CLOCY|nr:guanylate kinase [Clostridium cylindrosporum]KMT21446.1 guanylate kinase Gmk [Clostridium cylindrosporum DSM 605]
MGKGILVVLSGPSGAGKGTICKAFLERNKSVRLSISCTTRAPREGEVDGVNYFFTEKEEFEKMIKEDKFLEYANVYGNFYGTPKSYVEETLNSGYDIILEIDTQGALNIKESFSDGVFIFVMPPSLDELKSRIIGRGTETEETLNKRFSSAADEIKLAEKYNYAVLNDTVENAVSKIESIITAEKCKINRIKDHMDVLQEV